MFQFYLNFFYVIAIAMPAVSNHDGAIFLISNEIVFLSFNIIEYPRFNFSIHLSAFACMEIIRTLSPLISLYIGFSIAKQIVIYIHILLRFENNKWINSRVIIEYKVYQLCAMHLRYEHTDVSTLSSKLMPSISNSNSSSEFFRLSGGGDGCLVVAVGKYSSDSN